jgi:uncharacterized membrane protein
MNETITYEWSEKLGMSACLASHAVKVTRLWFLAGGGIILMILGLCSYAYMKEPMMMVVGFFGLLFLIASLRVYFVYRRLVKDVSRLVDGHPINVLIDDAGLTISSGKSTRTVEWSKTTEIVDRQGFLLLFCGTINLACLPKQCMSETQIDFIKSRVKK